MKFRILAAVAYRCFRHRRRRPDAGPADYAPEDHRDLASGRLHVECRGHRSLLPRDLGAVKKADPENAKGVRYAVSATQFIEVLPLPAGAGINRLDHTAYNTTDAEGMRRYLAARLEDAGQVEKGADGSRWFTVH